MAVVGFIGVENLSRPAKNFVNFYGHRLGTFFSPVLAGRRSARWGETGEPRGREKGPEGR